MKSQMLSKPDSEYDPKVTDCFSPYAVVHGKSLKNFKQKSAMTVFILYFLKTILMNGNMVVRKIVILF